MSNPNNPNSSNSNQANPSAEAWESLYESHRNQINQEFRDDQEFIDAKRKKKPIEYSQEDADKDRQERQDLRDERLGQIDALHAELERIQNRTEDDYNKEQFEDFAGERNFNDKKGTARTFVDKDRYPDINPEPGVTFGERTRRRNDLTVLTEYIPKFEGETPVAYSKRVSEVYEEFPRQEGEELDQYRNRIKQSYQNNEILASQIKHSIEAGSEQDKILQDDLKNIEDMKKSGRFDDEKANQFRQEVMQKALQNQWETSQKEQQSAERSAALERLRLEREERERLEAEAKERERLELEAKERERLELEAKERERLEEIERLSKDKKDQIKSIDDEIKSILDKNPLVAINADLSHDEKELAQDYAEQAINKESLAKRLWKGTLFKKYYVKKYEREILEGKRTVEVDGEKKNISEVIRDDSRAAISRFMLAAADDHEKSNFVHRKAGEKMNEANKETTAAVSEIIKRYATEWAKNNTTPDSLKSNEEIKNKFDEDIRRKLAELRDSSTSPTELDNCYDTAIAALERANLVMQAGEKMTHEIAMDRVMTGFKLYNAEMRDGLRTQAHRDNIDKITNWVEKSAVGQFIPAEIMAGALGVVTGLTRTGARAVAGAAGGIVAGSIVSGLKERNRITEDRARLLRDAAVGGIYEPIKLEGLSGRKRKRAERQNKYQAELYGTSYDDCLANELTQGLKNALNMEEGEARDNALRQAIAEARVRIDFSDEKGKDLIGYSSNAAKGTERLALDIALITAEKSLSDKQRKLVQNESKVIQRQIEKDVDERDEDFQHYRAIRALKKAGKTFGLGTAVFFGAQEITAAISPNKIGLFEKILKTGNNNEDASETVLASGFGAARGHFSEAVESTAEVPKTVQVSGDNQVDMEQMENSGWSKTLVEKPFNTIEKTTAEIPVAESTAKANVIVDGWADNGTKIFDGNEIKMQLSDDGRQIVSALRGISTIGGQNLDYDKLAAAGQIKGYITLGGSRFEVLSGIDANGNLTWGQNGVFTILSPDGTTSSVQAISKNGEQLYDYFEIAMDNGDVDGVTHIIPLATDIGNGGFSGNIIQEVEEIVEHPAVYEFTETITGTTTENVDRIRDIAGGIGFAPETARVGLGDVRQAVRDESTRTNPNTTTSTTPNTTTGTTANTVTANAAPGATAPNANTDNSGGTEGLGRILMGEIGEDGLGIIRSTEEYKDEDDERIGNWWGSLTPVQRATIAGFEKSNRGQDGKALKEWLKRNNIPEYVGIAEPQPDQAIAA